MTSGAEIVTAPVRGEACEDWSGKPAAGAPRVIGGAHSRRLKSPRVERRTCALLAYSSPYSIVTLRLQKTTMFPGSLHISLPSGARLSGS